MKNSPSVHFSDEAEAPNFESIQEAAEELVLSSGDSKKYRGVCLNKDVAKLNNMKESLKNQNRFLKQREDALVTTRDFFDTNKLYLKSTIQHQNVTRRHK